MPHVVCLSVCLCVCLPQEEIRRELWVRLVVVEHCPVGVCFKRWTLKNLWSPKVSMRIEIKHTKCEEIGIFCRNIAEKFILKFAKLFYIKKTRGFMPFSSTICDFYNKKLKFWIRRLVAYFHVAAGVSDSCLAREGTHATHLLGNWSH